MANYASLKAAVADVIKTNGANSITAAKLQTELNRMIDSLGAGYQFMGVATTSTNPGTPDQKVYYLAAPGTYTNFGNLTIASGNLYGVLYYDSSWHVSVIADPLASEVSQLSLKVDELDANADATSELIKSINGEDLYTAIDLTSATIVNCSWLGVSTGRPSWGSYEQVSCMYIPNYYEKLSIVASTQYTGQIAFAKEILPNTTLSSAEFAAKINGAVIAIPANTSATVAVPAGTSYIYIRKTLANGTDAVPSVAIPHINILTNKDIPHFVDALNVVNTQDSFFVNESIISANGTYYSGVYTGWNTTGYIPCSSGDVYRMVGGGSTEYYACMFNASKQALSSLFIHLTSNKIVIPASTDIAYVRISYKINATKDNCIYKTSEVFNVTVNYCETALKFDGVDCGKIEAKTINAEDIRVGGESVIGLVNWQYACGKIICIGDSLTDGLYVPNSQGQYTQGLINENYPYYLGRMLNATVFNAGKNGSYPSKFYAGEGTYPAWYPSIDFSQYDSVMLWLGTNGGLNTANENAANFTPEKEGWYYKQIIAGILSQNPTIKITLGKVFITGEITSGVTPANATTTNAFIDSVAEDNGLQVIDFSDLVISQTLDLRNGISNTHFGKAGNIFIADRICKEWKEWFKANHLRCEFGLTTKQAHNP